MERVKRFTGEENHSITKAEALAFLRNFKKHFGDESETGCFFDAQVVQAILDQPEAVGMRYYYGVDDLNQTQLILVGADTRRRDLLNGEPVKKAVIDPPLTEKGIYDAAAVEHRISTDEAAEMTARYRENLLPGQPKGGFFGKKAIQRLLVQPDCIGLRFFYGAANDGARVIVILCVDKNGEEMFDGPLAELSIVCPPICGPTNPLNHDETSNKASRLIVS